MDIKTIATNDLVIELANRFDAFVVAGVKFRQGSIRGQFELYRNLDGSHFICESLICRLHNKLDEEFDSKMMPLTDKPSPTQLTL